MRYASARPHLIACLLLLFTSIVTAAEPLSVTWEDGRVPVGRAVEVLVDPAGELSIDEVRGAHAERFQPSLVEVPSYGQTRDTYWFRFSVRNEDPHPRRWWLQVQNPLLHDLRYYIARADGRVDAGLSGYLIPADERPAEHQHPVIELPLAGQESAVVYLRVFTEGTMKMPLTLWTPEAFQQYDHDAQWLYGLYYGLLLAMLLYNLWVYLRLHDVNHLYYVLYIAAYGAAQLTIDGQAFEYLWPRSLEWATTAALVLPALSALAVLLFARSFLRLKQAAPLMHRLVLAMIGYQSLVAVLGLVFGIQHWIATLVLLGSFSTSVVVLAAGAVALARGVREARIFLIAWSVLLVGISAYVLAFAGLIPSNIVTEHMLLVGSALEVVLLSFALADRMRSLQQENLRVQREARERLEERVRERTAELKVALEELAGANATLKELTTIDGLTGVQNRRYFDERLAEEWRRAMRSCETLVLLMVDVDHFKQINDSYGHQVGDQVLRGVAAILKRHARRGGDVVARYGGEEFAILLANTPLEKTAELADQIRRDIDASAIPVDSDAVEAVRVTISIGAAAVVPDDAGPARLIKMADRALYDAKACGRNQVRWPEALS